MNVVPISSPVRGEHLAATSPPMKPETPADWHQRLNFWPGRALTAEALEIEQEHRGAHLAWHGRLPAPGIVAGLEVALEEPEKPGDTLTAGHYIHVLPGYGLTAYGEDVTVPRPVRISLKEIPVRYARSKQPEARPPAGGRPSAISDIPLLDFRPEVLVEELPGEDFPWAAVLVARPAEFITVDVDPDDPCELDLSRDAFARDRRNDAAVLWLVELPASYETGRLRFRPTTRRRRNQLAYAIFEAERNFSPRQYLRRLEPPGGGRKNWSALLTDELIHPWELFGVPLGLLSTETDKNRADRFFLDRAAVVRPGGRARARSRPAVHLATGQAEPLPVPGGAGTAALWRARVDQFAEEMAGLTEIAVRDQAANFQFLPPAGLLPRAALVFLTSENATIDGPSDRAATSHFFPATFGVEAVPIALEELDAALASSAPLAPYDLVAKQSELVRVLVPLPQRLFDPHLLVIEKEDPFFAIEVARLVARRQDWRQRRDLVRARRDALRRSVSGPTLAVVRLAREPDQLEPEPVEDVRWLGFSGALVSPAAMSGACEVSINLPVKVPVSAATRFYVDLRLDLEEMPDRIEANWEVDGKKFAVWTEFPPAISSHVAGSLEPPVPLWRRFRVGGGDLGITAGDLVRFTLRIDNGRVALGAVGQEGSLPVDDVKAETRKAAGPGAVEPGVEAALPEGAIWFDQQLITQGEFDAPFWKAGDEAPMDFVGGEWTPLPEEAIPVSSLLAPFEAFFTPEFPDGLTLDARLAELPSIKLVKGGPRQDAVALGLEKLIQRLDQDVARADDFVDLAFLKTQTHTHRIRQVLLGDEVADNLLISPTLSSAVKKSSARVLEQDLVAALRTARAEEPATPTPRARAAAPGAIGATPADISAKNAGIKFGELPGLNVNLAFQQMSLGQLAGKGFPTLSGSTVEDVRQADPAIGKGFELRTLTIAKRFDAGPVLVAYDYADANLREILARLPSPEFDLDFAEEDFIPDVTTKRADDKVTQVSLGEVASGAVRVEQLIFAESVSGDQPAGGPPAGDQLGFNAFRADTGNILAKGVRRADAAVLVLRRLEFYIARRRVLITRAKEVLAELRRQIGLAEARLAVIAGPLAEARHDVGVARALWQEERERVAAINARRDALIRDEVKFLAYVRPRTFEIFRRNVPGWKLESADTPAPIPACLQRHDQPPDPLRAYVQLFRYALASWFTDIAPRLRELDTPEKLSELLVATQRSALLFSTEQRVAFAANVPSPATKNALISAFSIVEASRTRAANFKLVGDRLRSWKDFHQEVERHSSLGDIISGRHGHPKLARAAADLLQQIEEVATCLHAEFAAVPPAIRLAWVERYSQFDQPAPLDNLTTLPRYGSLDRPARRRFQTFSDWLFARVNKKERDAFNLVNDLIRICLLLASHAPVKSLIAGHLPRPVPVRPGGLIPVHALDPHLVRVGMEVHVWKGNTVVARARVEDLHETGEISARIERLEAGTATLDENMRVQFVPAAFGFAKSIRLT